MKTSELRDSLQQKDYERGNAIDWDALQDFIVAAVQSAEREAWNKGFSSAMEWVTISESHRGPCPTYDDWQKGRDDE